MLHLLGEKVTDYYFFFQKRQFYIHLASGQEQRYFIALSHYSQNVNTYLLFSLPHKILWESREYQHCFAIPGILTWHFSLLLAPSSHDDSAVWVTNFCNKAFWQFRSIKLCLGTGCKAIPQQYLFICKSSACLHLLQKPNQSKINFETERHWSICQSMKSDLWKAYRTDRK